MSLKDDLQIILITYNRAVLLTRTLESILGSNSPIRDFDITIFDNNSTDKTCNIVEQFAQYHQNLKYEKNTRNLGVNGNIIKAYLSCKRKYIWILCDDDYYDFSNWFEIEKACKNNEDFIIVSRYAFKKRSPSIAEQILQTTFVPSSIIKTTLITDTVARNMIESAHTLFGYLQIFITFINGGGKAYVLEKGIVEHGLETELTDYSYTRGHNPDDLTLQMKAMSWTCGFAMILQSVKSRSLQIEAFDVAINAPDIFRGDWQGFYNHIVSLYHNPQLWPMFLNIYTILDDSHKKELMELLFLRYPEIKYNLKEGNEEMAFICNNDAENIHFNCKNIFLPAFLIRLFSHITFGKTKKEYKSKWIQLKHHKKNSNFLGRLCAMEREKNELTKLDPINQQKLNIGKCITLSALLDGKVRLSPIERGKKIVRSFCIEVTNNPYVGYETSDGFIYFIALPYSCYWGYFDNNYIFHPFDDPNMMFGIPLYPQEVLKEIILLKQKKSPVLKIRKKRIMLLATWNLGHHIWQEQPGIDFLKENNMLKKIRYMYYFTDYFNMSSYLKQFNIKSKLKVNHNFTTTHILVYCTEDVFFKKTADRLLAFCKNGSDISLSQNYINVIIALRWNQRVWREENTGIAEIINSLTEKYERISFCIDGFSKPAGNGDGFNSAEKIQKDKENMCRLMENLTPQALERIHSIIGKNCIEKVKLYSEAALLIMPFGTPEHINWMSRKPVILYGPKAARDLSIILNSPVVIPDLKVDSYLISERDIIDEDCGNYSMDWHILYNAIDQKLIQILKQKALTFNGEKNE